MRVDCDKFRRSVCYSWDKYSGIPIFGKCMSEKSDIYRCAERLLFGPKNMELRKEFKNVEKD